MNAQRLSFNGLLRYVATASRQGHALALSGASLLTTIPFETALKPLARRFRIDNPYINYPFVANEHVPVWLLGVLGVILPVSVILGMGLMSRKYRRYSAISALAFVVAMTVTIFVCDILKFLIGNQRPDFIARCAPDPSAPVHEKVTVEEVCLSGLTERVWEGCRSTPSGHSAISFAGLGFLAMWFISTFDLRRPGTPVWKKVAGASPLLLASWVAFTRIIDHKHHWIDIIFGGLLGSAIAHAAYVYVVQDAKPEAAELHEETFAP